MKAESSRASTADMQHVLKSQQLKLAVWVELASMVTMPVVEASQLLETSNCLQVQIFQLKQLQLKLLVDYLRVA